MNRGRTNDPKLCVILLQVAAVALIIVTVTVIKALGGDLYTDMRSWYVSVFEGKTLASEVLDNDSTVPEEINEGDFSDEQDPVILTNAVALDGIKAIKNLKLTSKNSLILPVNGVKTSGYGVRDDPFTGEHDVHKGLDIAAASGCDILAAADGVVSYVGYDEYGYGNYLTVNHSNGFKTLYGHCSRILVAEGASVSAGDVIARVGNTGRTTGPHLHFEILINGNRLNPEWFLDMDELK